MKIMIGNLIPRSHYFGKSNLSKSCWWTTRLSSKLAKTPSPATPEKILNTIEWVKANSPSLNPTPV